MYTTEGNSQQGEKWIINDEAIVAPKPCAVCTFVIPIYSKSSNCHVYYNAIVLATVHCTKNFVTVANICAKCFA